jgi:2-amino-4-hydroxy-6-hydroxymethyldihydropteridine diphosphokinase
MPFTAYIGIGSNQCFGERGPEQIVAAAIKELETLGRVHARSSLYGTRPVGMAEQPAFVNAVAEIQTSLDPEELMEALIHIERGYGRDRAAGIPKGPRTLDLDLLFAVGEDGRGIVHRSPSLTLPHREAAYRRFVLAPLAEIAPELRDPILQKTIVELLAQLPDEGPNAVAAVRVLDGAAKGAR